ncbi:YscO family type III secretion system apparatus protein [Anaerobiospirillum sp. NML120449]|uniref:type III secretion system stalk subunit SctO n=1 Tax=Anaerobiospirillum sp. NML120449 TaxID=2932817 RepID=UPI001FF55C87|nr:YscO family type III secretion system apparatus protein [Anaerobiospirillum sp. NML120449]MCK0526962.1 type III secretion protein [Anaerobiospirillum sp. NML120449]
MEQYPLQALYNLREMRQGNARRATAAQRKAVADAVAAVEKATVELEEFKRETERKVEAIYDEIMGLVLSQKELAEVFARINGMYAEVERKKLELEGLKQKVIEEEQRLEELKQLQHRRDMDVARLDRHKEIWAEKQREIEEYKAEQALEDFVPRKPNFFDEPEE